MRKYDPLSKYLSNHKDVTVTLTFEKINTLLPKHDGLPNSAYKYRAWWANDKTHSHATSWLSEGYKVIEVNQD